MWSYFLWERYPYSLPRRINRYKTLDRVRKALMRREGRLHVTLMGKWAGRPAKLGFESLSRLW